MKYLSSFFLFLALISLVSCSDNDEKINEDLAFHQLEYTRTCGWCADGETIIIKNNETIEYSLFDSCDPSNPKHQATRDLTDIEKESLMAGFDMAVLGTIELNQCGVCYDGCDDLVAIEGLHGELHSFLYDNTEYDELDDVHNLIDVLKEIRESF